MTSFSSQSWAPSRGGPISVRIPVEDESRIGEARRAAEALAESLNLDSDSRGVLAIVASEAATNLARHAKNGAIYLRPVEEPGRAGVEIIAVDSGPGMVDVKRSLADGYSTGGTSGHGLGAMGRLATEFDIYSMPGAGTALVARIFVKRDGTPLESAFSVGVICRPIEGEDVCGDGWRILQFGSRTMVLVVDGLGHGASAAVAADLARERFKSVAEDRSPKEIVEALHETLRATRGAALVIADIHHHGPRATVTIAGVGNITTSIVGPMGSKALPSVNGTAGHIVRNLREFSGDWNAPARLVFATDGLTTRWRLDAYPGIFNHDPALAAALLYRDHTRGRDDVTVLALALRGAQPQ